MTVTPVQKIETSIRPQRFRSEPERMTGSTTPEREGATRWGLPAIAPIFRNATTDSNVLSNDGMVHLDGVALAEQADLHF